MTKAQAYIRKEVVDFNADGGLVMDTRWLLQLNKRVGMDTMTATEAAEVLVPQVRVITLPDDGHVPQREPAATTT